MGDLSSFLITFSNFSAFQNEHVSCSSPTATFNNQRVFFQDFQFFFIMICSCFIFKMVSFTCLWILIKFTVFCGCLPLLNYILNLFAQFVCREGLRLAANLHSSVFHICQWGHGKGGCATGLSTSMVSLLRMKFPFTSSSSPVSRSTALSLYPKSHTPCSYLEVDSVIAVPRLPPACCSRKLCYEASCSVSSLFITSLRRL